MKRKGAAAHEQSPLVQALKALVGPITGIIIAAIFLTLTNPSAAWQTAAAVSGAFIALLLVATLVVYYFSRPPSSVTRLSRSVTTAYLEALESSVLNPAHRRVERSDG